jgi:hypothetical protein
MMPLGGISFLFHCVVILVDKLQKSRSRKISVSSLSTPIPQLFAAGAIACVAFTGIQTIAPHPHKQKTAVLSAVTLHTQCQTPIYKEKPPFIILRIDDIQAYSWEDVQKTMIQDAQNMQIPVSLGVIPYDLDDDKDMIEFLNDKSCGTEIAQHGWDHGHSTHNYDVGEFEHLNYHEAKERIEKGKDMLRKTLHANSKIFIPPNNIYSDATEKALYDEGFTIISSEGTEKFDYTTSSFDFVHNKVIPTDTIVSTCKKDVETKGVCIIMLHPQEYADKNTNLDPEKYKEYKKLLTELKNLNIGFGSFTSLWKASATVEDLQKISTKIQIYEHPKIEQAIFWSQCLEQSQTILHDLPHRMNIV